MHLTSINLFFYRSIIRLLQYFKIRHVIECINQDIIRQDLPNGKKWSTGVLKYLSSEPLFYPNVVLWNKFNFWGPKKEQYLSFVQDYLWRLLFVFNFCQSEWEWEKEKRREEKRREEGELVWIGCIQ